MTGLARWFVAMVLALALLALALPAVAQEGGTGVGEAAVRLAFFAPEAGPVRVQVGAAVPFPEHGAGAVTGYRLVPAGDQRVVVTPVMDGADAQGPDQPDAGASLTFEPGAYYTLLVTVRGAGDAAELVDVGSGFRSHLVEDAMDAFPAAGWAWLRVVHAIEGAGALQVRAAPLEVPQRPREDRELAEPVLATELTYATASGWSTVPAGSYTFEIGREGADGVAFGAEATLRGGALYTLFAHGAADAPAVSFTVDALLREAVSGAADFPENAR